MQHADAVSSTVSAATKQKRHKISQTLSPDMPFMIAFIYFLYAKRF